MQSLGLRASRAGKLAGGCIFLLAMASTGASAQSVFGGILDRPAAGVTPLIDTRDFSIAPMVGLQESFTDNALLTSTNKKVDFITRPMVGAEVNVHGPFTASFIGHAYYDAYASQTQLSGLSGDARAAANYVVIPDFLAIDANAMLMNTSVSTFGTPAINRVGPANQIQIATYDIGPHLTTTLDDFADVDVVGRFAQIFFDNPNASVVGVPNSAAILSGTAAIDTGERYRGYELLTGAQVDRDDHNFEAYNISQAVFVQVFPSIRLIGRGGYDYVMQPGIVNISDSMWSAGAEYTFNELSKASLEYGGRYGHASWRGELHLQLSQQLFAEGNYFEAIQPSQLQINSGFNTFATISPQLPVQLGNNPFQVNGNIDGQTALNKQGDLALVYVWETQSVGVRVAWNDRMLLPGNTHDRSLITAIDYQRNIAVDLGVAAGLDYYHTFANPFFGTSETYGGRLGVQYDINPSMLATAGYAYERQVQLFTNGQGISENVLYAAITKRF